MLLNNYSFYSKNVFNEPLKTDSIDLVNNLINDVQNLDCDELVDYVLKKFNFRDTIMNYSVSNDIKLNYEIFQDYISLEIVKDTQHDVFCFNRK